MTDATEHRVANGPYERIHHEMKRLCDPGIPHDPEADHGVGDRLLLDAVVLASERASDPSDRFRLGMIARLYEQARKGWWYA